jgi:TRAP-type C4-dicarboxylate transport system permease small subunit
MASQKEQPVRFGVLVGVLLCTIAIGTPLVSYVWETINQLLSGPVDLVRVSASVPALLLLVGCLAVFGRVVSRLDATRPR